MELEDFTPPDVLKWIVQKTVLLLRAPLFTGHLQLRIWVLV